MKATPIVVEAIYNAAAPRIWKALTDTSEMKNWYFDIAAFKPEPGFRFQFSAGHEGKEYLHVCEVKEAVENEKLSYSWSYPQYPGDTLVTFELFSEGGQTKIRLTHTGTESFPEGNPDFARESFEAGWTEIIGKNLKNYVEK